MENQSSITALASAFGRAYHSENDTPVIFQDTLSRQLITDAEYQQIQSYMLGGIDFFAPGKRDSFSSSDQMLKWIVQTQIAPTPLARARYCEDSLKTAMLTGTSQYVILGAGMDTFAFRNPQFLNELPVFEVDHPLTQQEKQQRIARAGWELPQNLHFVPMDFTEDDFAKALFTHGYRKEKKTYFSCLGVSYYLTKAEIGELLNSIAAIAPEGSSLLFDYASADLLTSPVKRVQNMIAMAAAGGEPMISAFDHCELTGLLEAHGFLIYEHLNPTEIQRRFFADRIDDLSAFEHIHYALAVLKKN